MAEGFILCYQTKDEMSVVYGKLLRIKKDWFDIQLYQNQYDVPYPYTIVLRAHRGAMYDLDEYLVSSNVDLGFVDMYSLEGREDDIADMTRLHEEEEIW